MPAHRKFCRTKLRLTEELAWLLGMLAADGGLTNARVVRVYPGLDRQLADRVALSIELLFGVKPTISQSKHPKRDWFVYACRKDMHDEISSFAKFGLNDWTVPERVKQGDEGVKSGWLRGFFDGDGCAHNADDTMSVDIDYKVSCSSINISSMRDVSALLLGIGIQHGFGIYSYADGVRRDKAIIQITHHADLLRFRDLVGFYCEEKAAKLEDSCKFKRKIARYGSVAALTPEIEKLRREGKPISEVAEKVGLCEGAVKKAIRLAGLARKIPRSLGHAQAKLPEILVLRGEGLTLLQIAERLGLTDGQTVNGVLMWARRTGKIPTPPKVNKTLVMAEKVAALRKEGRSYSQIADEIGTDPSTACKTLKKAIERGWIKARDVEPEGRES